MGQRLREIAGLAPFPGIVLLRQQAEIVGHRDHAVEHRLCLGDFAGQHIGVGEPEAAGEKRALDRLLFIGLLSRGIVPQHEAVAHHVFFDRLDGAADAGIGRRQKAHRRQHQDAGVEQLRSVGFDERVCARSNPFSQTSRWMVSRSFRHRSSGASKPNCSALLMARSNATHVMTLDET